MLMQFEKHHLTEEQSDLHLRIGQEKVRYRLIPYQRNYGMRSSYTRWLKKIALVSQSNGFKKGRK